MEGVIVSKTENNRLKPRSRNSNSRTSKNRQAFSRSFNINNNNKNNRNALTRFRSCYQRQANVNNNKNAKANQEVNITDAFTFSSNGNTTLQSDDVVYGPFTREVFNAICVRLGNTVHIPGNALQEVFNEMQLYPSKSQVSSMIQVARQCSRRNGSYVTFGEFCLLAKAQKEMQRSSPNPSQLRNNQINNTKCKSNCEVFLGGSCNPTTWRADTAIPALESAGISFYNPQVSTWAPELVAEEHSAKQSASILFFVVDSQTRSTSGMIEVAYLVASGRCVILVAYPYHLEQSIMGEMISQREYNDLVDGQNNLMMLVKSRGVKVHKSLTTALQCTANILHKGISPEQQVINKLRNLRQVFDLYGGQSGEISLLKFLSAYKDLTNHDINHNELYSHITSKKNVNNSNMDDHITFDKFCALVAEFSSDGCDTCRNGRFLDPCYWSCAYVKTQHLLKSYLVEPVTNVLEWATKSLQRQNSTNNNSCNIPTDWSPDSVTNDTYTYEVYLGGSLTTSINWRYTIAIPLLKKHGRNYYNPAIRENYKSEILDNVPPNENIEVKVPSGKVLEWKQPMDKSKVLFFAITNDTRSLTSMILAAHYIGLNRKVVLCIQDLPVENCLISNEMLSKQAIKDYNRGRVYLTDLARRKQVPVFENIPEAILCSIGKLNEPEMNT